MLKKSQKKPKSWVDDGWSAADGSKRVVIKPRRLSSRSQSESSKSRSRSPSRSRSRSPSRSEVQQFSNLLSGEISPGSLNKTRNEKEAEEMLKDAIDASRRHAGHRLVVEKLGTQSITKLLGGKKSRKTKRQNKRKSNKRKSNKRKRNKRKSKKRKSNKKKSNKRKSNKRKSNKRKSNKRNK